MIVREALLRHLLLTALVLAVVAGGCTHVDSGPGGRPRVSSASPAVLVAARSGVASGDSAWRGCTEGILREATIALGMPPRSVMDKQDLPASGDRHDFLSPAPLWWPDPEQADGLPYVWNRQGAINPEYYQRGDQQAFEQMARAVQHLALAYFLTEQKDFASHAGKLLRVWFVDTDTRMNPNVNHAWYERGRNTGTSFGIMSLEQLPFLLDAVGMLEGSDVWTAADRSAFETWVERYHSWLTTSTMGTDAARIWNRFGTAYDAQAAACALFLSQEGEARQILERSREERINRLIRPDGRQPYALEREISFFNSVSSVGYLFQLATMGERFGMDLWNYTGRDGGSIRRALEYVAPYADSTQSWPYILEVRRELLRPVLQQAAFAYDDAEFRRLLEKIPEGPSFSPPVFRLYPTYYDLLQDTLGTQLMVLDEAVLANARVALGKEASSYAGAMSLLRGMATEALEIEPVSVMQKTMTPPSGSKHDFFSVGGYYWPDPTQPDGLPWIYRDGKVYPEYGTTGDTERLRTMVRTIPVLALAYSMTGDERYAEHATRMLRRWFLDPATAMNPNLRYAHGQPGVTEGSYYGIIQLGSLPMVMDAVGMLHGSAAWTADDQRGMATWSAAFLDWMLHDEEAPEAGRVWNNHGTNYDVVAVRCALMAGRRGLARELLERTRHERIDRQIRGDGRLPYELERNRAWAYTSVTVGKFVQLATMGSRLGVDLWNYTTPEGGGIRKAIDFLAVYADSSMEWPYADLDFQRYGRKPLARLRSILQCAAIAYRVKRYGELAQALPVDMQLIRDTDLPYLFYPYAPPGDLLESMAQ